MVMSFDKKKSNGKDEGVLELAKNFKEDDKSKILKQMKNKESFYYRSEDDKNRMADILSKVENKLRGGKLNKKGVTSAKIVQCIVSYTLATKKPEEILEIYNEFYRYSNPYN